MKKPTLPPADPAKPTHKSLVAKDNSLIVQMAKFELAELRLIAYCLAHYDPSSQRGNKVFTAKVEDFLEIYPSMGKKTAYDIIRRTMLNLAKKPLEFREQNKRHYWHWFSGFTYNEGRGEFDFYITPELQPYLLGLQKTFTCYRLKDVYQFKAASTWKLYELVKKWLAAGFWVVELDEFRRIMGVDGKYPRWDNLLTRILNPAIAEINEVSDLSVRVEMIRRGRRAHRLSFDIEQKKPAYQPSDIILDPPETTLKKALHEKGVSSSVTDLMVEQALSLGKVAYLLEIIPKILTRAEKAGADTTKYLVGALRNELQQGNLYRPQPLSAKTSENVQRAALACRRKWLATGGSCARENGAICNVCSP